ncbi:DUF4118 domain-containing protein, partial [Kibdelosporangium lantanae]
MLAVPGARLHYELRGEGPLVALVGGLGPALFASVFCALLFNYFFVPPIYSLTIQEPENLVTVIIMVVVAVLVAVVVDQAARRAA